MIERIINLIGIGRITRVDDSGDLQLVQVTEGATGSGYADRVTDQVQRVSEFGFASVPPLDSEVLVLNKGGDRSKPLAIATSHKPSRPKNMQPGDAGIYDVRGAKVTLTENGLLIDCAGLPATLQNTTTVTIGATDKITLDAPSVECTGNFKADQLLTGDGTPVELGALRDAFNAHKHGGVQTGGGTSGISDHQV